ncbi:MAG TPA: trehalase-like domain-containing protein [Bryobacteraceae bacterium]|nr:trehalase-like domain-containing protein [Bryobacteraceae bacterium]
MKLEDYALVGDCETAALVGLNGSIDWLCWPAFSSPACFAALLGSSKSGRWLIAPKKQPQKVTRKYRDHTLILETTFEISLGIVVLTDFMPIRERHSDVVRIVRCIQGRVGMEMEVCVRFNYGRTVPWTGTFRRNEWAAAAGTGVVDLRTQEHLRSDHAVASAEFSLEDGEQRSFVLTYVSAEEPPPRRVNAQVALRQTEAYWLKWTGKSQYIGAWKEAVGRSLITLKRRSTDADRVWDARDHATVGRRQQSYPIPPRRKNLFKIDWAKDGVRRGLVLCTRFCTQMAAICDFYAFLCLEKACLARISADHRRRRSCPLNAH